MSDAVVHYIFAPNEPPVFTIGEAYEMVSHCGNAGKNSLGTHDAFQVTCKRCLGKMEDDEA